MKYIDILDKRKKEKKGHFWHLSIDKSKKVLYYFVEEFLEVLTIVN